MNVMTGELPARLESASSHRSVWVKIALLLIVGYLCMTRSFAYLGVPGAGVFIGEVALAAFLIVRQRESIDRFLNSLLMPSPLGAVSWLLLALVCYGGVLVLKGLTHGYDLLTALQGFAFHYYPLFLFFGLWVGERNPEFLRRAIRVVAWFNGVYGVVWVLFLNRVAITIPGSPEVPLFGQPSASAAAMLGLLCFEDNPRRMSLPLLLNAAVLLGVQVRAEWLGLIVGLVVWGVVAHRLRRVLVGFAVVILLLVIGALLDVRIPAPESRGGEISTRAIVGRALAPIDRNLATQYTVDAESQAGTVEWRTNWWSAIWDSVYENRERSLFGHGYGFPLWDLVPRLGSGDVRTPHNVFFYALGYGGWTSVILFGLFLVALCRLLHRGYRYSGNPFGIVYFSSAISAAFFGNFFETPFGAIPFYIIVGLAAAPALQRASVERSGASRPRGRLVPSPR
jgi:hypothetical protein